MKKKRYGSFTRQPFWYITTPKVHPHYLRPGNHRRELRTTTTNLFRWFRPKALLRFSSLFILIFFFFSFKDKPYIRSKANGPNLSILTKQNAKIAHFCPSKKMKTATPANENKGLNNSKWNTEESIPVCRRRWMCFYEAKLVAFSFGE